ncbi:helix-turn-helix domain-containing protein [Proteus mirabilis]|uniref:helix-turn-helix domain-containing protein n=2 Tax=Proteus mirabilis TaxID=584 RepID=UPI001F5F078A|nr:helix-turn-helix transcriptional regulator [Proteus mirabilis]MDM3632180.1 helix-turn-helix transcriptional regulator [Proteus mirabilis]
MVINLTVSSIILVILFILDKNLMSTINKAVDYNIKQKRKELKMTGIQMGYLLGISQQHFSRLENGNAKITVDILFSIATILNVTPQSLLPHHHPQKRSNQSS